MNNFYTGFELFHIPRFPKPFNKRKVQKSLRQERKGPKFTYDWKQATVSVTISGRELSLWYKDPTPLEIDE